MSGSPIRSGALRAFTKLLSTDCKGIIKTKTIRILHGYEVFHISTAFHKKKEEKK